MSYHLWIALAIIKSSNVEVRIEALSSRVEIRVPYERKLWVKSLGPSFIRGDVPKKSNNGVNTLKQRSGVSRLPRNGVGGRGVGVLTLGVVPRYMRRVSEVR